MSESEKIVVPLKPVNHFSRLPNQKLVSQFIRDLKQIIQQTEPRCCFMVAQSITDAFLIVCFCFGQLALMDQLSKNEQISQQTIQYFTQSIQKYEWNKMSAFQTFQLNGEQFGKTYPKYFQQILSNYKDEEQVAQMFKKITQNELLYNVKIRIWDQRKQSGNQYKLYQRIHEQIQNSNSCNLVYLLITIDQKSENYNVGMVQIRKKVDVRDTIMTVNQQNSVLYELEPQEVLTVKQKSLKQEKVIENNMDLNKKPPTQKRLSRQAKSCGCQII